MPRRIEQLNEQLKSELAGLIIKQAVLIDGLITVCYVDCSTDLKHAKIAVSVLPDKLGPSALKKLKKLSSRLSRDLRNKLTIRQIPKFHWLLDKTESRAAEIEEVLKRIKQED